jgi:ATP synthase protein I
MTSEPGGAKRPAGPPRSRNPGASGAEFAGIGLQFAATIVVFMFGGIWLDRRLHTSPWLLLLCVFVGAGAGFYSIYRKLMAGQRRPDDRQQ